MSIKTILACLIVSLPMSALAADVTFTKKPTATRTAAGGLQIDFAVSAATDVAVFIENKDGKTVRHLVAGVLGKNPPSPLKADSLEQSLTWDGNDDYGKPVAGGPFRVRVAVGMKPQMDGLMLDNPSATGTVSALAVGPTGEAFVFHTDPTCNGNMGGHKIKVFDRTGKPLRTIWPMPANLPADRLKAVGVFQTADGKLVPRLHNYETLSFYPDPIANRGRSLPGFSSPTVDKRGRLYWVALGPRIGCVDKDGGVPYPTLFSEPVLKIKGLRSANQYAHGFDRPSLAASSDGKWLYLSGLTTGTGVKDAVPVPAVFRINIDTLGEAEAFLGDPAKPGSDDSTFSSPRGIAVANGLLYVADFDNGRVMAFKESDKSLAGKFDVTRPDTLGVDPATGAIYVCSPTYGPDGKPAGAKLASDLIKFDGLKTGKELYRTALPKAGGNPWDYEHRIAVDASAKPVVIWLPGLSYTQQLIRLEDAGDKFTVAADPRDTKTMWAEGPRDMNVDRVRDELYVKVNPEKWLRFNEKTGQPLKPFAPGIGSSANGTQMVPFRDGNLYTWSWGIGFLLFDNDGKKINWPGTSKPLIPLGGIMCFQERHLEVLSPEEMLIVLNPQWHYEKYDKAPTPLDILFPDGNKPAGVKTGLATSIGVIGPDGKLKRTVIWQCMPGATPRVDPKGNIYLAEIIKPEGKSYPDFFADGLESLDKANGKTNYGAAWWTSYVYGSIIKFPPTGGAVWLNKANKPTPNVLGEPPADLLAKPKVKVRTHLGYNPISEAELQGAEWFHFGFSPYSCWSTTSTDTCMCEGARFDVDPFGRVFYPNVGQFRIEVLDTNGNELTTFGQYGNEDAGRFSPQIPQIEGGEDCGQVSQCHSVRLADRGGCQRHSCLRRRHDQQTRGEGEDDLRRRGDGGSQVNSFVVCP